MAKLNAVKSAAELLRIIDNMKREMQELKLYAQGLEKTIEWMKSPDYAPGKAPPFAVARPAGVMDGPGAAAEAGPTGSEDEEGEGGSTSVPATGQLSEKLVELEALRAAADNKVESLTAELTAVRPLSWIVATRGGEGTRSAGGFVLAFRSLTYPGVVGLLAGWLRVCIGERAAGGACGGDDRHADQLRVLQRENGGGDAQVRGRTQAAAAGERAAQVQAVAEGYRSRGVYPGAGCTLLLFFFGYGECFMSLSTICACCVDVSGSFHSCMCMRVGDG